MKRHSIRRKPNHDTAQIAVVGLVGAGGAFALGRGILAERKAKALDHAVVRALAPWNLPAETRLSPPPGDFNPSPRLRDLADPHALSVDHDARKRQLLAQVAAHDVYVGVGRDGVPYLAAPGGPPVEVEFSRKYRKRNGVTDPARPSRQTARRPKPQRVHVAEWRAPAGIPVHFVTTPNFDVATWRPTRILADTRLARPGRTGSMQPGWQGARYEATRTLNGGKVAALIRADIKEAIAEGVLPPVDVTVKVERHSRGYSIHVEVTGLRAGLRIFDPAYLEARFYAGEEPETGRIEKFTPEVRALLMNLSAIRDAYNYDYSDSPTDFYDDRYGGGVTISREIIRQDRIDTLARLGLEPRTDDRLESTIATAIYNVPELHPLRRYRVRAFTDGGEQYRLQCVDERVTPPRILAQTEVGLGDILEMLYAWAREFEAKKNGRASAGHGRRR